MILRCRRCGAFGASIIPFAAITLFGCGSGAGSGADGPDVDAGLDIAEKSAGDRSTSRPRPTDAAIINGAMVPRDVLWTYLAEYGGGQILEEVVLDRRLERELDRRGLRVSQEDIDREEENLLFLVLGRATQNVDEAGRIIDATRTSRGLGPERYQALLKRNAMLRRLVRDDVEILEPDLRRLFEVRHGEKVRARIIVVATEREASELRARLVEGGVDRVEFAMTAMDHSLDATSAAGGLIEVFSTEDPAYPAAARLALKRVEPGELTPVIGLDAGFAFLLLEERLPADDVTYEAMHADLLREFRLRQERILMQQLALELVESTRVTPVDRAVGWSWRSRRESR